MSKANIVVSFEKRKNKMETNYFNNAFLVLAGLIMGLMLGISAMHWSQGHPKEVTAQIERQKVKGGVMVNCVTDDDQVIATDYIEGVE